MYIHTYRFLSYFLDQEKKYGKPPPHPAFSAADRMISAFFATRSLHRKGRDVYDTIDSRRLPTSTKVETWREIILTVYLILQATAPACCGGQYGFDNGLPASIMKEWHNLPTSFDEEYLWTKTRQHRWNRRRRAAAAVGSRPAAAAGTESTTMITTATTTIMGAAAAGMAMATTAAVAARGLRASKYYHSKLSAPLQRHPGVQTSNRAKSGRRSARRGDVWGRSNSKKGSMPSASILYRFVECLQPA
ncbi:MAG: hypothetical protein LUE17_15965 [Planctomycetaceae bacterium]|nr:hypothetical protein [Planctomycetaceae bacterium]